LPWTWSAGGAVAGPPPLVAVEEEEEDDAVDAFDGPPLEPADDEGAPEVEALLPLLLPEGLCVPHPTAVAAENRARPENLKKCMVGLT
jgi:hypothetical protein